MSESQGASKKAKRVVGKSDAVRYHCNYCGKDISNVIRIKCAVCQDFDLCIQCFSVGVEIAGHKNNHDYHVMDALNFPLFEPEWGADEELLILEGIEMYGIGNWSDISDHVGTKTAPQCKEHYFKIYIDTPTAPLPDMTRILTTTESLQQRNKTQSLETDSEFWDELEDNDNKKESVKKEEPPITQGGTALGYSFPELAGYMPLRGDFETEYENDAETVLCEMYFNDDDTKEDIENKLKLIEAYNKKLDERIKRKRFIIDNGLLEYKKKDKKRSKEEKDVYDKMRQFLRLMNKEEHNQLTNAMLVEKQIRKRIEELKKYRRMGLHTIQESLDYEEEKKKKDFNEMVRKRETGAIPTTRNSSRWMPTKDKENKLQEKQTKPKLRKPGSPLDIQGAPGYDLLSEKERELCANVRIFPQQYTLIKDTLIRESIRQGYLKKAIARQLIKIDVNKTSRIFDFFEASGWINKSPRSSTPPLPPVSSALPIPNGNAMLLNTPIQ